MATVCQRNNEKEKEEKENTEKSKNFVDLFEITDFNYIIEQIELRTIKS